MLQILLPYFAYAVSGVACLVGLGAMLFPKKMSEGFGVPISGAGVHYVRALGVRDIFVGIVVLLLGASALWAQLGYVCLAIALIAASDFYTVFYHGERKTSLAHFAGFVLSLMFAAVFLS